MRARKSWVSFSEETAPACIAAWSWATVASVSVTVVARNVGARASNKARPRALRREGRRREIMR